MAGFGGRCHWAAKPDRLQSACGIHRPVGDDYAAEVDIAKQALRLAIEPTQTISRATPRAIGDTQSVMAHSSKPQWVRLL